jgi:hypothetical protein
MYPSFCRCAAGGKKKQKRRRLKELGEDGEERPREHPFIVSEPGDIVRGKKNGLDYLFDLYEQCGKFLEQCQQLCKEKGEKCPMKVINIFLHMDPRVLVYSETASFLICILGQGRYNNIWFLLSFHCFPCSCCCL